MKQTIWIGTYTDELLAGIHALECDSETGALRPLSVLHGIENPTYLALNRARNRLYTVCSRRPGAPARWSRVRRPPRRDRRPRPLPIAPTRTDLPGRADLGAGPYGRAPARPAGSTSSPARTGPGAVPSPKGRPPRDWRPCGVSQFAVSGPCGTICVGFRSLCTM